MRNEVLDPEREGEQPEPVPEEEPTTAPEPDTLPEEPDLNPPDSRRHLRLARHKRS